MEQTLRDEFDSDWSTGTMVWVAPEDLGDLVKALAAIPDDQTGRRLARALGLQAEYAAALADRGWP